MEYVETEYGKIKGIIKSSPLGTSYRSFTNIPYMKPPVGNLRFLEPQKLEKWQNVLYCTNPPESYCVYNSMIVLKIGKEDAAIINVYVPARENQALLPVLVNIHGGGFQLGSSKNDFSGPDYWMERNVVLVTFNYRLGPMGFLSLKDPNLKIPGNVGLKDQVFALKWVKNNIKNFGGNPDNITLIGESAGAVSVHLHMLSDQSKGLFHKAILISGSSFDRSWSVTNGNPDFPERLAKKLGWDGNGGEKEILEVLEKANPHAIMKQSSGINFFTDEEFAQFMIFSFTPVIEPYSTENCFIDKDPREMAKTAWSKDMPCLIGGASIEGVMCHLVNTKTNYLNILQDVRYFAPSRELNIELKNAVKYGEKLKELYFKNSLPVSLKNFQHYLDYAGDRHIWHGLYNAIKSRAMHANGKTFAFYFDADGEINLMKKMAKIESEGAAHGDMGVYLFSRPIIQVPEKDSIEFKLIDQLTKILEAFMIFGVPNVNIDDVEWSWKPVESDDFKCLHITERRCEMIPLPKQDVYEVWNSIYDEEKIQNF